MGGKATVVVGSATWSCESAAAYRVFVSLVVRIALDLQFEIFECALESLGNLKKAKITSRKTIVQFILGLGSTQRTAPGQKISMRDCDSLFSHFIAHLSIFVHFDNCPLSFH